MLSRDQRLQSKTRSGIKRHRLPYRTQTHSYRSLASPTASHCVLQQWRHTLGRSHTPCRGCCSYLYHSAALAPHDVSDMAPHAISAMSPHAVSDLAPHAAAAISLLWCHTYYFRVKSHILATRIPFMPAVSLLSRIPSTLCVFQVRQDAVFEMSEEAKTNPLDFVLVVGGWDSSNTAHLLEIPHGMGITGCASRDS